MKRIEFSRAITAIVKVWTQATFRDALSASRTNDEKEVILSDLYERFTDALACKAGEVTGSEQRVAHILLKKLATG